MTRKDHDLLAWAIGKGVAKGDVLGAVCEALLADNPRFNLIRFKDYVNEAWWDEHTKQLIRLQREAT